jgi:hypothetical protein
MSRETRQSNRTADGGIQPSGPRGAVTQYTSGAEIIPFPSGRTFLPDSRDFGPEPFLLTIDAREIGALFLVGAIVLVPWAVVAGVVFLYLTLVS